MHHRGLPPLFEKGSHIAQVGLEFRVAKDGLGCLSLLVPLPKRWDYSRTPLSLVDAGLGVEPRGADSLRPFLSGTCIPGLPVRPQQSSCLSLPGPASQA